MLLKFIRPLSIAILVLLLAACDKSAPDRTSVAGETLEAENKSLLGSLKATDMPEVAKKHNCNACHGVDKKVVGPSWKAVSKKYQGDSGAAAKLSAKITKGGGGVWGSMPMPPNPKLSEAEKKELVDFILGAAK